MKKLITVLLLIGYLDTQAQAPPDSLTKALLREGDQYLTGKGKPKDHAKALQLFLQCANIGNARAMKEVGMIYNEGTIAPRDTAKAIHWVNRSITAGYVTGWYYLGMIYKEETSARPDFQKVYDCFSKGAELGDDQCVYAKAYMHYKGLGCSQDYNLAASLFRQGAKLGRSNSMYFYGLCLRNGYGISMNADSAKYWLMKAAKKGYGMAIRELSTPKAENGEIEPKILATQLKSIIGPEFATLNRYQKINHNIQREAVEGEYSGHIIRYDWSGRFPVSSSQVTLSLKYANGRFTGTWKEHDTLSIPVEAVLTPQALVFQKTAYKRRDHYSPKKSISYEFEEARLQWKQSNDTIILAGNISMFSPDRNEPEKPLFLLLSKVVPASIVAKQPTTTEVLLLDVEESFKVYPNPVAHSLTVDFHLLNKTQVLVQLFTVDGKLVYTNKSGQLEAGYYTLPITIKELPAGSYFLKLQYGKQVKTIQVLKQ